MRRTNFVLESLPGKVFEGYTLDENWNGFACPYFPFNEARRITEAYNQFGGNAKYDDQLDAFTFNDAEEVFPAVEINALKVYPVGAFHWIWSESES